MTSSRPMIEVQGLRRTFGRTVALDGLDMVVEAGKVMGLLGRNGAGKTTLVRILSTLDRPDQGRALVAGYDVKADPLRVRSSIGLAGQYASVDEALTGRENLEMVGQLYRLRRTEARRRAVEVLDRLSLTDAADRPVRTYSGGMRRRLDLGASLVGRPAVLLLDEPSTGLDPAARVELWSYISQLVADGTTLLLTTQQLEEADHLADDVTIIDHGRVAATGTPDQLKGRLADDTIDVTVVEAQQAEMAAATLAFLATGIPITDRQAGRVSITARHGTNGVAVAVRALDDAGIQVADVTVRQPSLDDVFLAITRNGFTLSEAVVP